MLNKRDDLVSVAPVTSEHNGCKTAARLRSTSLFAPVLFKGLVRPWKIAAADLFLITAGSLQDRRLYFGILPHESRDVATGKTNEVIGYQHLAIAVGSGANADRR